MQLKTIRKNIEMKMDSWLESIKDDLLRKEVRKSLLVSGGCITSMLLNEEINDYDVYIQDREVLLKLTKYYIDPSSGTSILDGKFKQEYLNDYHGHHIGKRASELRTLKDNQIKISITNSNNGGMKIEYPLLPIGEEISKYRVSFISPNAISLYDNVQLVIRFHGSPEEIHKTFDFLHATNYFTFEDGLVTNKKALESILTKTLCYQGSLYPVTSIIRAKKFIKKNWGISAGELLKIMFQISLLDLTNLDVLEEQLIGVDVAYFDALIKALRSHAEAHPDFKISPEYLNVIIDKIFNEIE